MLQSTNERNIINSLGAFSRGGLYDFRRIRGCMKTMLHDHPIHFVHLLGSPEWMFQQNNASCHASKSTQE